MVPYFRMILIHPVEGKMDWIGLDWIGLAVIICPTIFKVFFFFFAGDQRFELGFRAFLSPRNSPNLESQ